VGDFLHFQRDSLLAQGLFEDVQVFRVPGQGKLGAVLGLLGGQEELPWVSSKSGTVSGKSFAAVCSVTG